MTPEVRQGKVRCGLPEKFEDLAGRSEVGLGGGRQGLLTQFLAIRIQGNRQMEVGRHGQAHRWWR
jgi:hypothetical protein